MMVHRHRWRSWGTSVAKGFEGKEMSDCKCGAVMFLGVLEPGKKEMIKCKC